MRNLRRRVVAFLLIVTMGMMYCPAMPATAVAATSAKDVITLNAKELTGWTVGKSGTFYAYINGARVKNSTLNWSSSNTSVATCVNGVLTAKGPGTAVISCTKTNATAAKCTVTVKGNDVITLNASTLTNWPVGKTGKFYAYVNGKRVANNTLTWSSSNTSVATCVNGVLTAKGAGTAVISCSKANATVAKCTVTVKGNDVVTLNTTSLTNWPVGKTGTFYAYINGKRVANKTLTWSSSNTSVATCVNGVLTAKGAGTAVISCTRAGATVAKCTVTVKGNDVVTLNTTVLTNWPVGKTGTFYAYINGKRVSNNTLTWSSSNTSVATCVNGVLTAKRVGTAVISCSKAGATVATCRVTVTAAATPTPTVTPKPTATPTPAIAPASGNVHVQYRSKQEIVNFIKNNAASVRDALEFAEQPKVTAPYSLGVLSDKTLDSTVNMVNQIRFIAGLDANVVLDDTLNEYAQAASLVNYINNDLTHYPEKPEEMDDAMYAMAYRGASSSNIAWASWQGYTLNQALVLGWMEDGDSSNIDRVGHRRWVLYPYLGKVGFGSVSGARGTYHAMYVFDTSNRAADEYGVLWPAQNMPLGFFNSYFPWSISVGTPVDMAAVKVTLTRRSDGRIWTFRSGSGDGYFNVNNVGYGQTGCIIFRPDSVGAYQDGDIFDVVVTGTPNGDITYSVCFFDEKTYSE